MAEDPERNSFGGRIARVASVGANMGAAAASFAFNAVTGPDDADARIAAALKAALGRTKGPLMKIAQMMATIPDLLPPEYATAMAELQANAPSMGWPFVKRRMRAELGEGWEDKFANFEREAAAAASLGQVHRCRSLEGVKLAAKLQYPDMASAVEADLGQLNMLMGFIRSIETSIDGSEVVREIGERLREELDYERERKHMLLYRELLTLKPWVRVPQPVDALCTGRLLTMSWVDGRPLLDFVVAPQPVRNRIAEMLFDAWWVPMTQTGVIHGDPHLGNYSVVGSPETDAEALNLLDFGCVRIFPPKFVSGVVALYRSLDANDFDASAEAYRTWGFVNLSKELIEVLNLWARFIYGPLLDDRVRTIADGIKPGEYGRKEAFRVRQLLKERGPVRIPAEFVFMDRAAIGLGAAFLHLGAELNFYRLFQDSIAGFDVDVLAKRQQAALTKVGLLAA